MKKMNLVPLLCAMLLILFAPFSCQGQSIADPSSATQNSSQQAAEIDTLLKAFAEFGEFNGAVLVAQEGKVIYQKGHGFANMEWQIPNDTHTKFRIGSVTKQFTAMLIVQLVADGIIDLHEPITTYLPEYPKENGNRITIHHLLTHSSGIPNNYGKTKPIKDIPGMNIPDNYAAKDLVAAFASLPLEFEPGSKFSYCNAGYSLLGLIIERMTKITYEQALKERIFKPLDMKNSGFDKFRTVINNRASGYFRSWGNWYNANYIDMSNVYAAGALYSSVEDLNLWDQALYTEKLVPKAYLDLIFTPYFRDESYGGDYGYGWSLMEKSVGTSGDKVFTITHDGVIDGFCAMITRIPSSKSSIILLSNSRRGPLNAITRSVLGILNDHPYDFPKRSTAYSTLEILETGGLIQAAKHFEKVRNDKAYYTNENEINAASYKLLQADKLQNATEILKLGIEHFPDAFNLYDSLGEVLLKMGKREESIRNYKKSLELNPSNDNAKRVLKEMDVASF